MTGSAMSAAFYGTASLPWIYCSCTGFVLGTIGVYRDSLSKSLLAIDLFPKLLQFHLDRNFPARGFRHWKTNELRSVQFTRSWTLKSMLIVSWMTSQNAIDVRYPFPLLTESSERFEGIFFSMLEIVE